MLATRRANGFGLTMACGECAGNLIEANTLTHKLYIFNNFIMSYAILVWHTSAGMKWMVLFFPLPPHPPPAPAQLGGMRGYRSLVFSGEESHYCWWRIKCYSHMEIKKARKQQQLSAVKKKSNACHSSIYCISHLMRRNDLHRVRRSHSLGY